MVYLIGAGPGDPGLITARGLRCLGLADVVLYDHIVPPRLLRHARPTAEKIDVGTPAPQPQEQEAICYLLAEKARDGKVVARLKWGDPFVFDSGGSEALFLHEQHIPFEVVPGVPAGVGVSAYAGVPISYPGAGDTIVFVRGFEDDGRAQGTKDIDWSALARLDGTIVCYTGPGQLSTLVKALLSHGRPPEEPAALVVHGTLATQRTTYGTLGDLMERVDAARDRRPGLFLLGRAVGLREHLRWFDAKPLFGRRILVTRPREQASEMSDLIESLGGEPIEAPFIRIVPPDDYSQMDAACAAIQQFDWLVFSSANAVEAFFQRLFASPLDLRALSRTKLCAVGPATTERLARYGLKVDLVPAEYRAESVVEAFSMLGAVKGLSVLIPRADIGREVIGDELRRQGASVTEVVAYRTVVVDPEREGEPDVYRMLLDKQLDVVTFASASSVRSFVRAFGKDQAADLLRPVAVAAIGPVTAQAAAQYGIHTTIMPTQYTVPALVDALVQYLNRRPHTGDTAS
ncbi:MAG: uroporphyrinogen-III C-methyltransferase [Acidimicrobiia bacterium]|nr:uroporphyrinogen-III C-methyltransferase [Acidimicrobiia bacterium]